MTTRTKVLAVALLAGIGGYVYLTRKRCGCLPGGTFKRATLADVVGYSKALRDQVARCGGYCTAKGSVEVDDSSFDGLDGPVTSPANYNPF